MRCIVALLCTLLLVHDPAYAKLLPLLIIYNGFAAYVLLAESSGRTVGSPLVQYWIDVGWTLASLQLIDSTSTLMAITLVQPVALASIGYGLTRGFALALFGAAGMVLDMQSRTYGSAGAGNVPHWLNLFVLVLGPTVALLARPMTVLRERLDLVQVLASRIDPRRGLDELGRNLVEELRRVTGAEVAGLVLPAESKAPAFLSNAEDGTFRLSPDTHARLESLLASLPAEPATHVTSRWPWSAKSSQGSVRQAMSDLSALLDVQALTVVPLLRYGRVHGHVLLGGHVSGARVRQFQALAKSALEVQHLVEQAALVDQLQEEFAAYERVRIGRDLHDSAIQPYLGLKYAVESVALRVAPDNPLRSDLDGLVELVAAEIDELRDMISGLRSGEPRGDNALVPSVRRQARRFATLFGIDVQVDLPRELLTSRTLAGAVFHMVNEALNNARKHTAARRITLSLRSTGDDIVLRVRDDGGSMRGRPMPDFHPSSLAERAAELGGRVQVARPDGLDTEVLITIPHSRSSLPGR
jgi:signal transduction histidine kinase